MCDCGRWADRYNTHPFQPTASTSPEHEALAASGACRIALILDSSGSVWGRIRGKPKIAIVKKVMTELVDELPEDLHAGLTLYGHGRKVDCEDKER